MTNRFRVKALILTCAAFALALCCGANADEPVKKPRPLKCVYFTPSDCEPVPDRAERLWRVMKCVQDFYRNEMERNGFGPMTIELEEEAPGKLKLYEVRAPEKQEVYGRDSCWDVRNVVVPELKKLGIDASREVVVIFQQGLKWEDGKAIEVASFVGAGNPFWGTAWFYDDPMLDPELLSSKEPGGYYHRPCTIGEFNTHYIGGIAHELGHSLTLPHDCELATERPQLGSALMGGGNHTFGREKRGEGKGAFLTYSEALRLSVVPAISGQEPKRRAADVEILELRPERVSDKAVKFTGKIDTKVPLRGLIFYLDRDARASDYDAKTWTVLPKDDGSFEITLTEVASEPLELRIAAVRDIDTLKLLAVRLNPNGQEEEFEPVQKAMGLKSISDAFIKKDADALEKLAKTDFDKIESLKSACLELAAALRSPAKQVSLDSLSDDVKTFDLSDAAFESAKVGWSRLTRRAFFDGAPLILNGVPYASGLCAHANSQIVVNLDGKWKTFEAGYGLQASGAGSVVFVVKGDDKELFRSDLIKGAAEGVAKVDVSGVKKLELITEDGGNGATADHSIWVNPVLSR